MLDVRIAREARGFLTSLSKTVGKISYDPTKRKKGPTIDLRRGSSVCEAD